MTYLLNPFALVVVTYKLALSAQKSDMLMTYKSLAYKSLVFGKISSLFRFLAYKLGDLLKPNKA